MTLRSTQLYKIAFIAMIISISTVTFAQTKPYRANERQVTTLINSIASKTDTFRRSLDNALDGSRIDGSNREDNINSIVRDFEDATDDLKNNFSNNRSTQNDVQELLNRAVPINRFMQNNLLSRNTQNQWKSMQSDLNRLANYYRVSWRWNNQNDRNYRNNSFDSRLTGTYRLNTGQSDDVADTIERAISKINYNENQRVRVQNNLQRRLISPETMMIEKRGQQITLASSMAQQVTLTADGKIHSETSDNGRSVKIRTATNNDNLSVSYEGDRVNDYYVTFTPTNNNQLRVSRRIHIENRNEMVTIDSVYDKTNGTPNWNTTTYTNNSENVSNPNSADRFTVPNNTRMTATLDSPLSTRSVSDNDRFTMTVNSPSQYNGAIIEGRVTGEKSGVVSGRATLSLTFETIRLTNGTTYRFAGIVEKVSLPDGSDINVNNEGTVRDGSQTGKTATRTGAGAILGAIVGAIVGGGQGAAIGAGIGAGAGAGSVVLQGRNNLELPNGAEFTIVATGPGNQSNNR